MARFTGPVDATTALLSRPGTKSSWATARAKNAARPNGVERPEIEMDPPQTPLLPTARAEVIPVSGLALVRQRGLMASARNARRDRSGIK